jgi:preprotein translocase subunit SecA
MLQGILKRVVGTKYERELKRLRPYVEAINALEPQMKKYTDEELRAKTAFFKKHIEGKYQENKAEIEQLEADIAITSGEDKQKLKDKLKQIKNGLFEDIFPEAFAVVREASFRVLNMRHFDVQLMGGIVLHEGKIAEMKTGEGKTLVATLPAYLNALTGKGVHIITVNDYLARRDSEWMGKIFKFLGLTVGLIQHEMDDRLRKEAYLADITYGTNNEFGFDYLRDNMKFDLKDYVQRSHQYAIVDEVDSILIDEARTPLIISGEVEHSGEESFAEFDPYIRELVKNKQHQRVNELLDKAAKMDGNNKLYDKAELLLKVKYAAPKSSRYLRMTEDKALQKLVQDLEANYQREKELSSILDDAIYYSITEESRTAELNSIGRDYLIQRNPQLFAPIALKDEEGVHDKMYEIQRDETLSVNEKEKQINEIQLQMEQRLSVEHNINQLLKAYTIFEKDVDYVVKDEQVVIVDEFTGRMMPGRRWSDGLHQAVEAKEGVKVAKTNQTLATVTLQNYFRMYEKLSGMTGTADTEAVEFNKIYSLDVVVLPTNKPLIRCNFPDAIYRTEREKFRAVVDEIERLNKAGRPVLVGTISVEKSEKLSKMLKRKGVKHHVLNAKYHEKEADIIALAGQKGTVTISTNMAGRGTDIILGDGVVNKSQQQKFIETLYKKHPDPWKNILTYKDLKQIYREFEDEEELQMERAVNQVGGLHIIGTERHESRRIDDQLRGRAGRQGDPGSSRFYLSLEDDLMRIFGSERISNVMLKLGMEEGQPIEHSMITKAIENAQKRVEANNFEVRKRLLEYDDVMNKQREVIYQRRRQVLEGRNLKEDFAEMFESLTDDLIAVHAPAEAHPEEWDLQGLIEAIFLQFSVAVPLKKEQLEELNFAQLEEKLHKLIKGAYESKERQMDSRMMRHVEKIIMLQVIDSLWKEHLYAMDQLKEGIGLRGYGQKDPLIEYKREGFEMFSQLMEQIKQETVKHVFRVQAVEEEERREQNRRQHVMHQIKEPSHTPERRTEKKIGRNDPCTCGSGKKYKKCCGK